MISETRYIELPTTIHAVAVQNHDDTFDIYVNSMCPEDVRQAAIHELVQRIEREGER